MKSFRTSLIFIVLVGGLVAFTIYDFRRSNEASEAKDKALYILKIRPEEMTKVEMITRVSSTTLLKKDGKWRVLAGPLDDLADAGDVAGFLASIQEEKTSQLVGEGRDINLATFGLDQPVTRLKVTAEDGRVQEVRIGSIKAYDSSLYAQIAGSQASAQTSGDEQKVWLVSSAWDGHFAKLAKDFRDKHLLRSDLSVGEIKRIEIKGRTQFELVRDGITWRAGKGALDFPIANERVESFVQQIKGVRAKEFANTAVKSGKAALEIRLWHTDEKKPAITMAFSTSANGDKSVGAAKDEMHARSSELQNEALIVMRPVMETVDKTVQDFYDKKLPFRLASSQAQPNQPESVPQVAKIEIDAPGVLQAAFTKKGEEWVSLDPGLQKEINGSRLNEIATKLMRMEAARVIRSLSGQALPVGKSREKPAKILLRNAADETLFELNWSSAVVDRSEKIPLTYHPARTNKSNFLIAVTEGEIKGLGLDGVLKSPASVATPAPQTTPQTSSAQ